jgi:hypothetical protein
MYNFHRIFIVSFALLFAFSAGRLLSQEALERTSPEPEVTTGVDETKESGTQEKKQSEGEKTEDETEARTKSSKRDTKVLQDMMTAEEFRAAGLEKLSSEELKNLNAWLQGYRQTAETKAAEKATAEATQKAAKESVAKLDKTLSRVDGEFKGLTGHTVIKLEDGTVWKQANADDRLKAQVTYHPPVAVMHGVFGYKMRVVGTGEFYVNPVRNP